jgi:hypothetical protein
VTSPKKPDRRTHRRTPSKQRPAPLPATPARQAAAEHLAFTDEWWKSWQRANALGWDYLNAVSGLFRLPFNAMTGATRFMSPFQLP